MGSEALTLTVSAFDPTTNEGTMSLHASGVTAKDCQRTFHQDRPGHSLEWVRVPGQNHGQVLHRPRHHLAEPGDPTLPHCLCSCHPPSGLLPMRCKVTCAIS